MEWYNINGELEVDDPHNIHILETEDIREMEGLVLSSDQFMKPLKIKKVNIGSPENPKFANNGDYWDDEMVGMITDLLHEFQDLFPTKFFEMKGTTRDHKEMNIPIMYPYPVIIQN